MVVADEEVDVGGEEEITRITYSDMKILQPDKEEVKSKPVHKVLLLCCGCCFKPVSVLKLLI